MLILEIAVRVICIMSIVTMLWIGLLVVLDEIGRKRRHRTIRRELYGHIPAQRTGRHRRDY
jgi:hypothetical protein